MHKVDALAKQHDISYDAANTSGLSGVLFSFKTIDADYILVYNGFKVTNAGAKASTKEEVEGATEGLVIGFFALPKTLVATPLYMSSGNSAYEQSNNMRGDWISNLPH